MKCNICGGEILEGKRICEYCGNIMPELKEKDESIVTPKPTNKQRLYYSSNIKPDVEVCQQRRAKGGYCVKCGRPLDGVTHKCIVCDVSQVSQRVYKNEDFRNREMNNMAQKKKKKKKNNTIRNILLTILAMIIVFSLAVYGALKLSKVWGIGGAKDDNSTTIVSTNPPKVTADPGWKADVNDEKKDSDKNEPKEIVKTPDPTSTPQPTQKPTMAPVRTPEPVETGDPVDVRGGEYLYESDTRLISNEELSILSREKIKLIYWEIYARHGYTFDNELADYFENNHKWYMPTTSDEVKVRSEFNETEKKNIETIETYQREKGWR